MWHYHLKMTWQLFIQRPTEQQFMEEAAIIVAQWFQPETDISYSDIDIKLDNILQKTLKHLRNVNYFHPIFDASDEQFRFWKYNNINENQWSYRDGKEILNVLCTVLSEQNFHKYINIVEMEDNNIFRKGFFLNRVSYMFIIDYVITIYCIFTSFLLFLINFNILLF